MKKSLTIVNGLTFFVQDFASLRRQGTKSEEGFCSTSLPTFAALLRRTRRSRSSTYKLACFCTWMYNFLFHAWSSLFLFSSIFQHPYFTGMTLAPTVEEELPAKPPPPRPTPPARPAQPPARPSEPPARPAAPPARPAPPPG